MRNRLLVIDDFSGIRKLLQHELTPDYEVHVAADGPEGLEAARRQEFSLVLSDINLPTMSGLELHQAMREIDPQPTTVLMTDADVDGYLEAALSSEICNIIAKPTFRFDMEGTRRLLRDLEHQHFFGMERRLGAGGEVRTFVVAKESEIDSVLSQIGSLIDQFPRREVYRYLLPALVREAFQYLRHAGEIALDRLRHEPVYVSVGADWRRVGMGVSCPGSRVTHRGIVETLIRGKNGSIDDPGGDTLAKARELMDQMFVNLSPGVRSELLIFDLLEGYRGPHSFHVNAMRPPANAH